MTLLKLMSFNCEIAAHTWGKVVRSTNVQSKSLILHNKDASTHRTAQDNYRKKKSGFLHHEVCACRALVLDGDREGGIEWRHNLSHTHLLASFSVTPYYS